MSTSRTFVLGAIVGAAVVWLWGRPMEGFVEERTRGVRAKAAEGVRAIEETATKMLDRGGNALRRADELLQGREAACQRDAPGRGGSASPGGPLQKSLTTSATRRDADVAAGQEHRVRRPR